MKQHSLAPDEADIRHRIEWSVRCADRKRVDKTLVTLSGHCGCGTAPSPSRWRPLTRGRGRRADRVRNQSELMRASRGMMSWSCPLARIRTGWNFREQQVTVSETWFPAPESVAVRTQVNRNSCQGLGLYHKAMRRPEDRRIFTIGQDEW